MIDKRVAYALQVIAIHPHPMVGMEVTPHGVGVDIARIHLEGIGMEIHSVLALREVYEAERVCTHAIACLVLVVDVVASHHVLIDDIRVDHVAKRLSDRVRAVPVYAVSYELFPAVIELAPLQKYHIIVASVEIA